MRKARSSREEPVRASLDTSLRQPSLPSPATAPGATLSSLPLSGSSLTRALLIGFYATSLVVVSLGARAQSGLAPLPRPETRPSWSSRPLRNVEPPAVRDRGWGKTVIDRFILARLEEQGLQPAAPADKRTLIRRATFDLLGLPPTPEEVAAFIADTAPGAFARVVERLLDSPHYGERWGRHWLDVARYADNKGYVFFEESRYPWAWAYRDYVVRAFNQDKPFDRFVLEQLAADQLDLNGDRPSLAALGFLTVGDHFSNNIHDILDDRIDVVSRGLLGLTVSCARCHDHKFDPVTMADYYALYGVFRNSTEPLVPPVIGSPALNERYESFELELIARERQLRDFVETKHRQIVHGARTRIGEYLMAVYAQRNQPTTESFMLLADQGDLNPTVISRWRSHLERAGETNAIWAPWHQFAKLNETNFTALAPDVNASLLKAAPGNTAEISREKAGRGLNPHVLQALSNAPPKSMKDVADRYAALLGSVDRRWQELLSNSVSRATPLPAELSDPAGEELRRVLYGPDAPPDLPAQMDWGFLSLLPDRASQGEFQKLLKALEEWLMHGPEAPARAMALQDLPVAYEPRIFLRGNPNRPGPSVPRRSPQWLDPIARPFSRGSGRLELAQAMVDPGNPLTARVFVNRVWLQHFGAGLVTTPSDFGNRSEPPSHPALLDWLAGEFMRGGWRVKHLHRLIMNSAVYQQSSLAATPRGAGSEGGRPLPSSSTEQKDLAGSAADDPENRLLSRMNRRRHDFETQRDAVLAVAGKLEAKLGGPPVEPGAPRRTLYTFVNRLDVPPLMTTFDFPSPSTSCPQRGQTTVAPQALYLMNNEFVSDCAADILRRPEVAELTSIKAKVERVYALLFSRTPTASDLRRAEEFLGAAPNDKTWQHYAHALLLANEFVFVD